MNDLCARESGHSRWLSIVAIGGIFAVMLLLNHWMPLHRDDYDYSMVWQTGRHIASLPDVADSAIRHYFLHGGRLVTVFFLDLFLLWGKPWFDLANAALFTGLVLLLYFHARRSVRLFEEPGFIAVAGLLSWLSFPHFGEVAIWKSGSTVYLWSAFPAALFLLPYNLHLAGNLRGKKPWLSPLMFIGGLAAGWSVENLGVTVALLSAGISYVCFRRGKMPHWMPVGAAGALVGLLGLLAAPGNYVRYAQHGGKNFLFHIGNQFAANGEMMLYLLPAVLLGIVAWRLLKLSLAERWGIAPPRIAQGQRLLPGKPYGRLAAVLLLVYSYAHGGYVAAAIRDFLIAYVMAPLGLTSEKAVDHFSNIMAGFEEMAIYWLIVFLIYALLKQSLGMGKAFARSLGERVRAVEAWHAFPEVRFSAFLFALALFNNFVMIAAPSFPARATFSSTAMVIVGVLALLRVPAVRCKLGSGAPALVLRLGALAIGGFAVVSAMLLTHELREENDARIAAVARAAEHGEEIVSLPPIQQKNRALRHVFFVDFDNGVTKSGLCEYYGIRDILVDGSASLPKSAPMPKDAAHGE